MNTIPEPQIKSHDDWRDMVVEPDISHIEIEDGAPVDTIYSEKQQRLLTSSLFASWKPRAVEPDRRRDFFAASNVGVFVTPYAPPLVPDVLVSVDVSVHQDAPRDKRHNTYFLWEMGKPPDVVVEIVSNQKGKELTTRRHGYERMRVPYYIVWDPEHIAHELELQAFTCHDQGYVPMVRANLSALGDLSLRPWDGVFEGLRARWLRWYEGETLLLTGDERAEAEAQRANRLAAILAAHGIDVEE